MSDSKSYYSSEDVKVVADMLKQQSTLYEQLFVKLTKQLYADLLQANEVTALAQCYNSAEQAIDDFRHYLPSSASLDCKSGCNHCCSLPVRAPEVVIENIRGYIRANFSAEQQRELIEKLKTHNGRITVAQQRIPCPLLTDDKRCSIYSQRPPACRAFTSPNVDMCSRSVELGTDVPQHAVIYRVYQGVTTAVLGWQKEKIGSDRQVALVPSLLKALESPSSE